MNVLPTEPVANGAWMRFCEEHRNSESNKIISREVTKGLDDDTDEPGSNSDTYMNVPAFELVTTHRYTTLPTGPDDSIIAKKNSDEPPTRSLHLYSPALTNALRSVVEYYPSQDLSGNIVIRWPYAVLVHHYDALLEFRNDVSAKNDADLCERETGAVEHIDLLLRFLDCTIMPEVRKEMERNEKGLYTYEYAWVFYKPGDTILLSFREETNLKPRVIHSSTWGTFVYPPTAWNLKSWYLKYDGTYVERYKDSSELLPFDGESRLEDLKVNLDDLESGATRKEISDQLDYGKRYWELLKGQCKYHSGKTENFPHNEVNGLVMVDPKTYYTQERSPQGNKISGEDCRVWLSDCQCRVCKKKKTELEVSQLASVFEKYNSIAPETWIELTDHQYILCADSIPAFVFRTRSWETVHVKNLSGPLFDEAKIDYLIMDSTRKNTLMALSKSFARINKDGEQLAREPWAADFVAVGLRSLTSRNPKELSLCFLLHGRPGVGKTCTAECIASFTKRPLMILTPSDIGTDPEDVEDNLVRNFKLAKRWNAVLLIDEADVFMERRSTADLVRNSLVAAFLRALEFYDGILFLTTNRVGSFDDAFISRVHVQMYYPEFNDEQRQAIWKTFIDKLNRERSDIRITIDAKEYIRGTEIRALKWNGREIRNVFQTAVSLAEYESEKDEEGNTMVTDEHLKSVIDLSKDFKGYLSELHGADEAKRAERYLERLDTFQ
ncbi:P-loop containing nucleoside triphosphate hydrolase protein [Xylariaceae sp. FL0255]|nr:P-loop containing nucleoside triphosphate hydrolase protein [Xylariaceae sp. FL0255]